MQMKRRLPRSEVRREQPRQRSLLLPIAGGKLCADSQAVTVAVTINRTEQRDRPVGRFIGYFVRTMLVGR